MSPSSIEKSPKKHRKSKHSPAEGDRQDAEPKKPRRSKEAKADETSSASTPGAADVIKSSTEPAKEKMRKKRKNTDEEGVSESPQGVESKDSEHKKKKKRHKHEEKGATDQVNGVQTEEDDSGRKKKKKRKESTTTENGDERYPEDGGLGDEAVDDHGIDVQPSSSKREKKEKKRKQSEGEEGQARPEKKSKKKRKHNSSSGFPNPSEDESLNDQGRKALEYAFTQFEDPDGWKFHKARQNWLLRNIWSDEAVPEKYMPLATRYLQGVQGGARETLIKSCREALEPPKPATSNTETVEQDEIPPESSEADGTAKPTMRFTVDDKEDHNTALLTQATKQQRATLLLTALTS